MNDSLWRRARDIFEQAIEMDESRQMTFVHQACGADHSLLAEVKKMIVWDRRHNSLLDRPIFQWGVMTETTAEKRPGAPPFNHIGNYRLIRKIGEGGMGEVYLAVEEPVDRKVAIKLMRAGLDAEYLRRFDDERKALASLNQRNIVTMFAAGESYDRPYFVMEYLEGESLRARMRRRRVPLPEIAEITGQICDALNAAHNRGIVHRDIKPENIFLSLDDDGVLVKVLDFGVAMLKESGTWTATSAIVGTAAYLSPEQARGLNRKEIDWRADIYSLSVVVYEMLIGIPPFTASNAAGYQHLHVNVMPERPSRRVSGAGVTEAVSDVVMKALSKDPNERHRTAREFARRLKEAVNESLLSPVALDTKPPAPSRKAFLSRSALLLAMILLLLGGGGWWAFSHFKRSPDAAVAGGSSSDSQANLPGTASAPDVTPSAPASRPPDLKVELEQEGKGVVSPEARFKSGAGVRLIASPNQSGRVYIVMKGTVGPAEILYPDSRIRGSRAAVRANQRVEMPPSKSERPWFRFHKQPGVETLYIVIATQNDDESLQSLKSPIREKRRRLKKAEEQQTLSVLEGLVSGQSASTTVAVKKILLRHEK